MTGISAPEMDVLAAQLLKEDAQFRRLFQDHQDLEARLEEINRLRHWNADEELERKRIQKVKLKRKDEMERILRERKERIAEAGG